MFVTFITLKFPITIFHIHLDDIEIELVIRLENAIKCQGKSLWMLDVLTQNRDVACGGILLIILGTLDLDKRQF